jgi:hypothetical protein
MSHFATGSPVKHASSGIETVIAVEATALHVTHEEVIVEASSHATGTPTPRRKR